MGEDVNGCVVSLTCRMLSVQLGNFRENILRMLSSKSLYSWLLGGFFFSIFYCELCQLDLPHLCFSAQI